MWLLRTKTMSEQDTHLKRQHTHPHNFFPAPSQINFHAKCTETMPVVPLQSILDVLSKVFIHNSTPKDHLHQRATIFRIPHKNKTKKGFQHHQFWIPCFCKPFCSSLHIKESFTKDHFSFKTTFHDLQGDLSSWIPLYINMYCLLAVFCILSVQVLLLLLSVTDQDTNTHAGDMQYAIYSHLTHASTSSSIHTKVYVTWLQSKYHIPALHCSTSSTRRSKKYM